MNGKNLFKMNFSLGSDGPQGLQGENGPPGLKGSQGGDGQKGETGPSGEIRKKEIKQRKRNSSF